MPNGSVQARREMSPSVTKSLPGFVAPCSPTPSGTLSLSILDKQPALAKMVMELLHVFKHGREPAKVIKAALSKALVPYYPLAGKLVENGEGELEVACTGEGVLFVEASADCSLHDVNYMQIPYMISEDNLLLYPNPNIGDDALLTMQVTEFSCGGFTVGVRHSHAIFDGFGISQFLKAVGEIAGGLLEPRVSPIWGRAAIPGPPKLPDSPPPTVISFNLEYQTFDLPLTRINRSMSRFAEETGRRCSAFDVVAAKIWQSRARAINTDPSVDMQLGFPINARPLMPPPSAEGYYGNCVFNMNVRAASGRIAGSPFMDIVSLVVDAKEGARDEFWRWVRGEVEEDPHERTTLYETVVVTDLRWLGFAEVDYGWGTPTHGGCFTRSGSAPSCALTSSPAPLRGVRVTARCVNREHSQAFGLEMTGKPYLINARL